MAGNKRYYEQVEAFKEGKTSARKSDSLSVYAGDERKPKEIYSYNTAIAFQDKDGKVYLNKNKYSVTTSAQQNVIRSKLNPVELETSEFEKKRKEAWSN